MDNERDIVGSIEGKAVYKDEYEYYIIENGMRLCIDYDEHNK